MYLESLPCQNGINDNAFGLSAWALFVVSEYFVVFERINFCVEKLIMIMFVHVLYHRLFPFNGLVMFNQKHSKQLINFCN